MRSREPAERWVFRGGANLHLCLLSGEYLEKIIPLVVKFCNVDDDELREYCIQAFESFVRRWEEEEAEVCSSFLSPFNRWVFILRCPKEVYPHVPTVISICLRYLTYDPNYNFDDEDEDDNAMDAEQNDEDYQGSMWEPLPWFQE